ITQGSAEGLLTVALGSPLRVEIRRISLLRCCREAQDEQGRAASSRSVGNLRARDPFHKPAGTALSRAAVLLDHAAARQAPQPVTCFSKERSLASAPGSRGLLVGA